MGDRAVLARAVTGHQRRALGEGRRAWIAHAFHGAPEPANPYARKTVARSFFDWGVDRARRVTAQLEEIGA